MTDQERYDAICKDPRIDFISDERETASFRQEDNGNGIWIYLKAGWIDPETECHCVTEHKLAYIRYAMKRLVACSCHDCMSRK